jgi:hypothetical protein
MVYERPGKDRHDARVHPTPGSDDEEENKLSEDLSHVLNHFLDKEEHAKHPDWNEYRKSSNPKNLGEHVPDSEEFAEERAGSQGAVEARESDVIDDLRSLEEKIRRAGRARTATNEIRRTTGNVVIPDHAIVNDSLVVVGGLRVGNGCQIHGSIKASRGIEIGERVEIDGHVLSEGSIIIGKYSIVNGIVDSSTNIMLDEGATVEAVLADRTIIMGAGAKVNRKISSGGLAVNASELLTDLDRSLDLGSRPQAHSASTVNTATFLGRDDAKPVESSREPSLNWEAFTPKETNDFLSKRESLKDSEKTEPNESEYERHIAGELFIPSETLQVGADHLYICAPVRYGKTFLVNKFIIPTLREKRRIITIDSYREYPFEQFLINYDKNIPETDNELIKTFLAFNVRTDVDDIVKDAVFRLVTDDNNISIVLSIDDSGSEKMIVNELLKRISQIRWSEPVTLILEDADKYDLSSLLTRSGSSNIQLIMTSWREVISSAFFNARLILGKVKPELIGDYDFEAAVSLASLRRFEFLWEIEHHAWRRFRLDLESEPQHPTQAQVHVNNMMPSETIKMPPSETASMKIPQSSASPRGAERAAIGEVKGRPQENEARPAITKREAKVLKLTTAGYDETEIGLRLFMDQVEVRKMLQSLKDRGYYKDHDISDTGKSEGNKQRS